MDRSSDEVKTHANELFRANCDVSPWKTNTVFYPTVKWSDNREL